MLFSKFPVKRLRLILSVYQAITLKVHGLDTEILLSFCTCVICIWWDLVVGGWWLYFTFFGSILEGQGGMGALMTTTTKPTLTCLTTI